MPPPQRIQLLVSRVTAAELIRFAVPFLQRALAGKAKALLAEDRDLLSLARGFACPTLSAEQFIDSLQ